MPTAKAGISTARNWLQKSPGLAGADGGQPLQPDGKNQQRIDCHDEGGNRDHADGENAEDAVHRRAAIDNGGAAKGNAEDQGPGQRHNAEQERVGENLEDYIENRAFGPHVIAKIAGYGIAEEIVDLLEDGLVKAHAFNQLALEFGRGAGAESDGGGVARHQEDHGIHRQHDHKQDQHCEEYALDRVVQHELNRPPLYGRWYYTMSRLILSRHLR